MTYVITKGCCNDATCAAVCPVQCIRPRPGDPDFTHTEQLYIDPATCIDCGACQDVCPVDAVHPDFNIPANLMDFSAINAEYFQTHPISSISVPSPTHRTLPASHPELRVAVIGSGAAGCYAVDALSEIDGVVVSVFERLPVPFGLVRNGVAPDHPSTKKITGRFTDILKRSNVNCFFHVEVGRDVSLEEILRSHHAVIWAGGTQHDRLLGIPGEDLDGVVSAREFVAWYNGHPDHSARRFALDGARAVVIGNGNVALDIARTLLLPTAVLFGTDMSHDAVQALDASAVRDVAVVARRDASHAAFSLGELMALRDTEGITLNVAAGEVAALSQPDRRHEILVRASVQDADDPTSKSISLRFGWEPVSFNGLDRLESVTFRNPDGDTETIETSLALRAIGFRGAPVDGLPFDPTTGTLPNDGGRVVSPDTDQEVPGVYCSGWIRRGPRGTIGMNRVDAQETVDSIIQDLEAGRLSDGMDTGAFQAFESMLRERNVRVVDKAAWLRIDAAEIAAGRAERRPRKKLLTSDQLLDAADVSNR